MKSQSLLDYVPRSSKPLSALLADERACVKRRLVQSVLGSDTVSADTAAKPSGVRFLVCEAGGVHRPSCFQIANGRGDQIGDNGIGSHRPPRRTARLTV